MAYSASLIWCCISLFRIVESWPYDFNPIKCATMYSQTNFSGFVLPILQGRQYSDLFEYSLETTVYKYYGPTPVTDTWDKQINSIYVEQGCQLRVCKEAYLSGNCELVSNSTPIMEMTWNNTISSISCDCPNVACGSRNCSSVGLRENECGRAYFESDCRSCNGDYLTVQTANVSYGYGTSTSKVSSVIINKGCTFRAYSEEDFEGDEVILASGYNSDWTKTSRIGSYSCSCLRDRSVDTRKPVGSTSTSGTRSPMFLDIPITHTGIFNMSKLYSEHPGLLAGKKSMQNNRSPRTAYILAIGQSGSGISRTINFLLGEDVATTIADSSNPPGIREYQIPVPLNDLGCRNCELRIIDIPGLGNGLEQDAKTLAQLDEYLANHEELSYRFPNIILVVGKFTDSKFQTRISAQIKAFHRVDILRPKIFDSRNPNTIVVLTFMGEPNSVKRSPSRKIRTFRNAIEDHTRFPKPVNIVLGENLVEDHEMPIINGFYRFPKDSYPKNLVQKMDEVTSTNDPIGNAIIQYAFANTETLNITVHIPRIQVAPSKEQFYQTKLSGTRVSHTSSEIGQLLKTVYDEQISIEMKKNYPEALEYVQRRVAEQGVLKKTDSIPTQELEVAEFFQNFLITPLVEMLLEKSLNITMPELNVNIITGLGYNVLTNTVLPTSPFLQGPSMASNIGYKLPNHVTCKLEDDIVDIFELHESFQEYESRMGVKTSNIDDKPFRNVKPGHNIYNSSKTNRQNEEVSILREFRSFLLKLNSLQELNTTFQSRLNGMPEYKSSDRNSVENWQEFFSMYGTHVVDSAYGGWAIEARFQGVAAPDNLLLEDWKSGLQAYLPLFQDVYRNRCYSTSRNPSDTSNEPKLARGNTMCFKSDSLDPFLEQLKRSPTILTSSINLTPIYEVIAKLDPGGATKIQRAINVVLKIGMQNDDIVDHHNIYSTTPTSTSATEFEVLDSQIRQLLGDFEKTINKSRKDREDAHQSFLDLIKNNTKITENTTSHKSPTTTRRTTITTRPTTTTQSTTTRRLTTQTRRPTLLPPTTEDPNRYNTHYNPPRSLFNCRRAEGCFQQTGYSYDIRNDTRLHHTPFQLAADALCKYLPDPQPNPYEPIYVYRNHESGQEYINYRQREIGSNYELNRDLYKGGMVKGHNMLNYRRHRTSLSISMEFRLYENRIRYGCLNLNEEFRRDVEALPIYHVESCASVNKWNEFLDKYGTHFVNTTFVGGSIHVEAKGEFRKRILATHLNTQEQRRDFFGKLNWENEDFVFQVHGGDESIFKSKLDFNNYNFQRYGTSLLMFGGMSLHSDLTLTTMEEPISAVKHNLWESFREASNHYINNELSPCSVRKYCSKWWYNSNDC